MKTFSIIAKAAVAFYDELFHFLLMGFVSLVACILIVPAPFAVAGLYAAAQRAVRGEGVKWATYWAGVKEYGPRSLLLFVIILAGYILVITNLWFYNTPEVSPFPAAVAAWVTPLWIVVAVVWTGIAFYAESFLVELEKPTIPIILRNSLFLVALNPIPTILWLVLTAMVLALSIVLPVLLVITPTFIITLSITAVRTLVQDLMERAKSEAQPETPGENYVENGETDKAPTEESD